MTARDLAAKDVKLEKTADGFKVVAKKPESLPAKHKSIGSVTELESGEWAATTAAGDLRKPVANYSGKGKRTRPARFKSRDAAVSALLKDFNRTLRELIAALPTPKAASAAKAAPAVAAPAAEAAAS